jgi:type VI secretion system ImpA family protein
MNEKLETETFTIDPEKLLSPISGERPAGENLRYEGTYDLIQEARREDDPDLPQGVWKRELKKADWPAVADACLEALETRTKDLQIAAWLTEAWLHLHGFSGVREGLRLMAGLCEGFWDTLYPELEEDNAEYRVTPVEWINDKLSIQLKMILITRPQGVDVVPYSWSDWERAFQHEKEPKRDGKPAKTAREPEERITLGKFRGSVMLSPRAYYVALAQEVGGAMEATVALERLLGQKCGNRAPGLYLFKEVLQGIQTLVNSALKERGEEPEPAPATEAHPEAPEVEEEGEAGMASASDGPIRSRAEAYRRISEASDYLMRIEPHSPAPYLIKRAVAWGGMTLTELLQEFIHNGNDLKAIYALLGIQKGGDG